MDRKFAVVLLQFGGPDSLDAVEPFLFNLFNDADIVELPFGPRFQRFVAKIISSRRSKTVRVKYGEIGGKSPIVEKTFQQAKALQEYFNKEYSEHPVIVKVAMRYWKPFTEQIIQELKDEQVTDVVLLPLYAQYSKTNAGSSYNEWDRMLKKLNALFNERRINEYRFYPKYLQALNERINEAVAKFKNKNDIFLLFSAHGTPVDMVERGDPYAHQIYETMEAVMDLRGRDLPYMLSFQSKVGPKKWLTPATEETIKKLAKEGNTHLLIVPIAFVSDHIETLHELDIEARHLANEVGVKEFIVSEGLNDHPLFIQTLGEIAIQELHHLSSSTVPDGSTKLYS